MYKIGVCNGTFKKGEYFSCINSYNQMSLDILHANN